MKKYEIFREIGDGTYGIVYEGRNKETNQKVAIKKLKQKYKSLDEVNSKTEVTVLKKLNKLNNENIVQLKEVINDKTGDVYYIFEYCDCNLFDFIENHRKKNLIIPEPVIREIIFQITKGMKYMHSKKYFHRDLKPENILVVLNKYDLENMVTNEIKIKIADFGTAKEIPTNSNSVFPLTDYVCTRWYRAPECFFRGNIYDEKVDVWAIGCIMAELYHLTAIFPGENEFDQINQIMKILGTPTRSKWPWGYYQADLLSIQLPVYYKKDFKKILGYISKEGINLLNSIFTFDSVKRPSCSDILNHPYFKMIPKPNINISNSLKFSTRKNTIINNLSYITNSDKNKDNNSQSKNKYMTINSNNENKNKMNSREKLGSTYNKSNTKTMKKNNNNNTYILKRDNTKKTSDNFINIKEYKVNHCSNNHHINIKDGIAQSLSITEKKTKKMSKIVKLNEIKTGLVTKKIIQYTKSNKEEKKNDDKNEKKSLIFRKIGRNAKNYLSFNNSKKFSFVKKNKPENRRDSRNKSIEVSKHLRNTLSTTRKILTNYEDIKRTNENKKCRNKKIDIVNNNSIHSINCISNNNSNSNYKNINNTSNNNKLYKSITLYNNNNNNNKPQNYGRSAVNKINTKVIYSGKNKERNSEYNKNKYHNNHKFYISKGNKYTKSHYDVSLNNNYIRYINSDNFCSYNENENNNHLCICTMGRTYSTKKDVLYNRASHGKIGKMQNIKCINGYNRGIITPRNYFKKNNTSTNNISELSPYKTKNNKVSSLFSCFLNNNIRRGKYIITKTQSLVKNNISPINGNLNSNNNYKEGVDKIPIKNINIDSNNKRKSHIPNSNSKKRKL